jgi:hypothetical protein
MDSINHQVISVVRHFFLFHCSKISHFTFFLFVKTCPSLLNRTFEWHQMDDDAAKSAVDPRYSWVIHDLVGGLEHLGDFSIQLRILSSQLTFIFSECWYTTNQWYSGTSCDHVPFRCPELDIACNVFWRSLSTTEKQFLEGYTAQHPGLACSLHQNPDYGLIHNLMGIWWISDKQDHTRSVMGDLLILWVMMLLHYHTIVIN